jgi:uncharacterized protein (DUF362 family)
MSSTGSRTRREILADAAKLAAAASVSGLAGCFPNVGGRWPDAAACAEPDAGTTSDAGAPPAVTPAVVEVFREKSVVTGTKAVIQPDVVAAMLDAGLTALARQATLSNGLSAQDGGTEADDAGRLSGDGGGDMAEAGRPDSDGGVDNPWKVLLPTYQPGKTRIGLKVNCLNSMVPTSPALTRAIIASLRDKLGVDPKTIVVWDRGYDELTDATYSPDDLFGAQLLGTKVVTLAGHRVDTPGEPEYGDLICPAVEGRSVRLSRILTDLTDLTINCPVFKHHGVSGVTGAMKNIYGIIDNPGSYHENINTALPKLYALPQIRNSISLTIVDALISVTVGNTNERNDYAASRILLAQDPVAIDSYALVLLNQIRVAMNNPNVKPVDPNLTGWLAKAAAAGLGSTNYSLYQV